MLKYTYHKGKEDCPHFSPVKKPHEEMFSAAERTRYAVNCKAHHNHLGSSRKYINLIGS
jgi:hypothetical protein